MAKGGGGVSKASVQLREAQAPLVRVKLPVALWGSPLFAGCTLGGTPDELALHLGTLFSSGPSFRLLYRPVPAAASPDRSPEDPSVASEESGAPSASQCGTGRSVPLALTTSLSEYASLGLAGGRQQGVGTPGLVAVVKAGLGRWGAPQGTALSLKLELDVARPAHFRLLFKLEPRRGDFSLRRFSLGPPAARPGPGQEPVSSLSLETSAPEANGHGPHNELAGLRKPLGVNGVPGSSPASSDISSSSASLSTSAAASLSPATAPSPSRPGGLSLQLNPGLANQKQAHMHSATEEAASGAGDEGPTARLWGLGGGAGAHHGWGWLQHARRQHGWDLAVRSSVPLGSAVVASARWRLRLPGDTTTNGVATGASGAEGPTVTLTGRPMLLLDKISVEFRDEGEEGAPGPASTSRQRCLAPAAAPGHQFLAAAPGHGGPQAPALSLGEGSNTGDVQETSSVWPDQGMGTVVGALATRPKGEGKNERKEKAGGGKSSAGKSAASEVRTTKGPAEEERPAAATAVKEASSPQRSRGWRLWGRGGWKGEQTQPEGEGFVDAEKPMGKGKSTSVKSAEAAAPGRSLGYGMGSGDGGLLGVQEEPWEVGVGPRDAMGVPCGTRPGVRRTGSHKPRDVTEELRLAIMQANEMQQGPDAAATATL